MNFKKNDRVKVARTINRAEGLYAEAGEQGVIKECFRPKSSGANQKSPWYAKVIMSDGKIKTFRLTSLIALHF